MASARGESASPEDHSQAASGQLRRIYRSRTIAFTNNQEAQGEGEFKAA